MNGKSIHLQTPIILISSKADFDQIGIVRRFNQEFKDSQDTSNESEQYYSKIIPKFQKIESDLPRKECDLRKGYHRQLLAPKNIIQPNVLQLEDRQFIRSFSEKFKVYQFSFLTTHFLSTMFAFLTKLSKVTQINQKSEWLNEFVKKLDFIERQMFEYLKLNDRAKFDELQTLILKKWISKNSFIKNIFFDGASCFKKRDKQEQESSMQLRSHSESSQFETKCIFMSEEVNNYQEDCSEFDEISKESLSIDTKLRQSIQSIIGQKKYSRISKLTKNILKKLKKSQETLQLMQDNLKWLTKKATDNEQLKIQRVFQESDQF